MDWWITGGGITQGPASWAGNPLFAGPYKTEAAARAAFKSGVRPGQPGPTPTPGPGPSPKPPKGRDLAQEFLNWVLSKKGDAYVYGATGPAAFDCSGLVWAALRSLGISAPRTSEAQYQWVHHITEAELKPGDLVFTQWPGDNAPPGHVQIYTGNGQTIGANDPQLGVSIGPLSGDAGHIVGYGRIPGLNGTAQPAGGGGILGGLLQIPSDITSAFGSAEQLLTRAMWLFNPEHWARIFAGVFGFVLLAFGLAFLVKSAA